MTLLAEDQILGHYRDQFADFESRRAAAEPEWLWALRESAIQRFLETGFPTTRDEEWRFTNLAPIVKKRFRMQAAPSDACGVESMLPAISGPRLVFVDGWYSAALSTAQSSMGIAVGSLAQAMQNQAEIVHSGFGKLADIADDPFTALNTAFATDGAFVHVSAGAVLAEPIQLIFVTTGRGELAIGHPRTLIVVDKSASAAVAEHYVGTINAEYLTNAVTEVDVGENAAFEHYFVEEDGPASYNISTLKARLGRSARFDSHSILLGGALVRNNVHPILDGEGGDCLLNGLYLGSGRQHLDNHMRVEHAKAHCNSRQYYKGILDGRSRGVFSGRIIVHPDAQKTDAKQSNMNLLLSPDAEADSKPQLEIYADDVKCTHGATIGEIDPEAVFYLRSRGIDAESARRLLVHAFASESIDRIKHEPLRTYLSDAVLHRLPRSS